MNATTGQVYSINDKKYYMIWHRPNGRDQPGMTSRPKVDETMVLSFYIGLYEEEDNLYNVVHHNRLKRDFSIENLVPIYTLKEQQSYFIWRLNELHENPYRVGATLFFPTVNSINHNALFR